MIGLNIYALYSYAGDAQICFLLACMTVQLDFVKERLGDLNGNISSLDRRELFMKHVRHIEILKNFLRETEETSSIPMFALICVVGLTMCAAAFRITKIGPNSEMTLFIMMIVYVLLMMLKIYLPCYYGTEIAHKSQQLTAVLYSLDWISYDKALRKDLTLMMTFTSSPMVLKAEGLFIYDLSMFTSAMNFAYSFYASLKGVF
ncbi:odorant receptor 94a-like [Uranotaenia lowii]|uniref:odorant receptor 94a-like n=1 Tax=Uranotaenia lowii TaxID=190385 RepID=UPI002478B89F|nr:odorant receptor 94a-like [Uranotaenia lowii]